jgi:hypothetical protein
MHRGAYMVHCREEQPCVGLLEFWGVSKDGKCNGQKHVKGVLGRERTAFGTVKDIAMARGFANGR